MISIVDIRSVGVRTTFPGCDALFFLRDTKNKDIDIKLGFLKDPTLGTMKS